jgi:hypothetical protein
MSIRRFDLSVIRLKTVSAALALMLTCAAPGLSALAAGSIRNTEYSGDGRVEIEFDSSVSYDDLKVSVSDAQGGQKTVSVLEKGSDELVFAIMDYKAGQTYTYTIEGVKVKNDAKSVKLSGDITIPASYGAVPVKEVVYDQDSHQVEIEFDTRVEWETPTVVITNGSYNMVTGIDEYEDSEIEVSVEELSKGATYKYTISGVRARNSKGAFGTVSGEFSY